MGDRRAMVVDALAALDSHQVQYALRNGDIAAEDPSADIDVLVRPRDLPALHRALTGAGWLLLRAPGHRGHLFYLREAPDFTWLKLDVVTELRYGRRGSSVAGLLDRRRRVDGVWVVSTADALAHADRRRAGRREIPTIAERLARALPVSARRRGCVVAVLGPDGAGKGTVTAALAESLPVGVTLVYLGDRRAQTPAAATVISAAKHEEAPAGLARTARETLFLLRKLIFLAPPLLRASVAAWRGHVVLTDRHPLDAVAVLPRRTPVGRALDCFLAMRVVPTPDAVVVLDAPGEVLFARKGEHSPAVLEAWRQGYRKLAARGAEVVDASGPVEDTVAQARHVVWRALAARRGWTSG